MSTQNAISLTSHHRVVRFFWILLIGATTVSLVGNIAHAALPYVPRVAIQIGAAAVPPVVLLAAVHGIALAVRAGASGTVYRWALAAVAAIGVGAFTMSFLALRDLMHTIGYGSATAWVFPAIIDTAVAVSTMMLVALGDKPVRSARTVAAPASAQFTRGAAIPLAPAKSSRPRAARADRIALNTKPAPARPAPKAFVQDGARANHAALAQALLDAGATTKPASVVATILSAHADGKAVNRIASEVGIHHKTVSRIIDAADDHRRRLVTL